MGEDTKHRNEDDHRPTMTESKQRNASAADDKAKSQHGELLTVKRESDQQQWTGADKKNENGYSDNGNLKRPRTVCYDFKKGLCRRRFCRVSSLVVMTMSSGIFQVIQFVHFSVSACVECGSGDFLPRLSKYRLLPSKLPVSLYWRTKVKSIR